MKAYFILYEAFSLYILRTLVNNQNFSALDYSGIGPMPVFPVPQIQGIHVMHWAFFFLHKCYALVKSVLYSIPTIISKESLLWLFQLNTYLLCGFLS